MHAPGHEDRRRRTIRSRRSNSFEPNPRLGVDDDADVTRLRPLATPLMTAGLPPKLLDAARADLQVRTASCRSRRAASAARSRSGDARR